MRYLVNSLREAFDLPGVPIRLHLRKGENPYAEGKRRMSERGDEVLFLSARAPDAGRGAAGLLERSLERGWRAVVQAGARSASRRSTRCSGPIARRVFCPWHGARRLCGAQPIYLTAGQRQSEWRAGPLLGRWRRARRASPYAASSSSSTAATRTLWPKPARSGRRRKTQGFSVSYWQQDEQAAGSRRPERLGRAVIARGYKPTKHDKISRETRPWAWSARFRSSNPTSTERNLTGQIVGAV